MSTKLVASALAIALFVPTLVAAPIGAFAADVEKNAPLNAPAPEEPGALPDEPDADPELPGVEQGVEDAAARRMAARLNVARQPSASRPVARPSHVPQLHLARNHQFKTPTSAFKNPTAALKTPQTALKNLNNPQGQPKKTAFRAFAPNVQNNLELQALRGKQAERLVQSGANLTPAQLQQAEARIAQGKIAQSILDNDKKNQPGGTPGGNPGQPGGNPGGNPGQPGGNPGGDPGQPGGNPGGPIIGSIPNANPGDFGTPGGRGPFGGFGSRFSSPGAAPVAPGAVPVPVATPAPAPGPVAALPPAANGDPTCVQGTWAVQGTEKQYVCLMYHYRGQLYTPDQLAQVLGKPQQ